MEILRTDKLVKHFKVKKRIVKALDGIDIFVKEKQTTALVGESGCGKTTLAKTILGFYNADSGKIFLRGKDITNVVKNRKFIQDNIQIVFQDPFLSFDPRYTTFSTLYETLKIIRRVPKEKGRGIIIDILNKVGFKEDVLSRFPHQLSGGQLQRISIGRALLRNPKIVILDEPTSNLDVSTTVRIIELLDRLQEDHSLSYLFISHNLKLIKNISHYIFVMYYGKIVEYGPKECIWKNPLHPYTKLLIEASEYKIKDVSLKEKEDTEGCLFKNRCLLRSKKCDIEPERKEVERGHFVYCHFV